MRSYLVRRIAVSVLMLLLTSLLIFVALRVIPGDPTASLASNAGVTQEQVEQARKELNLDRPVLEQYVDWLGGAVTGDLGNSYFSGYPASELIGERIWPTVLLCLAGMAVALALAVPAAIACAIRPESLLDRSLAGVAGAGMAIPAFWLGVMLVSLFAVRLGWLPARGYVDVFADPVGGLQRLLLPAVTLGIVLAPPIMRFLRASLLEEISAGYTRTAEGKGMIWRRVVLRHALPNALLPTLTFVGLLVGHMLGGIVVIEFVFGWPGLGSLAVDAVTKRDYIVLQSVVLFAAAMFIVVSLAVDLISRAIDPRLKTVAS
jgi:peptide/nickel transport system permease protein